MANNNSAPKPQTQDNPSAGLGRYSLFRSLLRQSTPKLRIRNPVSIDLGRKKGGAY
jgi:hypothetical protein